MEINGAEQWVHEKEEMERTIEGLRTSLGKKEDALQDVMKERQREKDRWKARLAEVERGVGAKSLVVNELALRRVVVEEVERRGGVERPGILAIHASIDGGETSTQWGLEDMQARCICGQRVSQERMKETVCVQQIVAQSPPNAYKPTYMSTT